MPRHLCLSARPKLSRCPYEQITFEAFFRNSATSGMRMGGFPLFHLVALNISCATFASGMFGFRFRAACRVARPRLRSPVLA